VSSTNIVGTILEYAMFGRLPQLDAFGRPLWAYRDRIHDKCERRGHFDAGQFVEGWNDQEGLKRGLCLFKVGCKGPMAYNNCGVVRYNEGISWPIMAGHGCIGCSEPGFWDTMTPVRGAARQPRLPHALRP
jgi:NiFe hydrogenase small subunit HydA